MARVRDKDMRSFKEATAKMNFKEKLNYIWEYYRLHIIGGTTAFILIFSLVHAFVTNTENFLTITVITGFESSMSAAATEMADEIDMELPLVFSTPFGIGLDFDLIETLESYLLDEDDLRNYSITVSTLPISFETLPVLMTHAGAGALDLIITYTFDFNAMSELGHFTDIKELMWDLPNEIFYNSYGIYLRYFPIFDDYITAHPEAGDLIIAISAGSVNFENIEESFMKFLNN